MISSYLMTERVLEPDLPEKPFLHICTEAIICPFYRILGGISAIVVQLVGSGKLFYVLVFDPVLNRSIIKLCSYLIVIKMSKDLLLY